MTLRRQTEKQEETLQEMELAAELRFGEGLQLLYEGWRSGGVYLLGYVAEMLLKISYFRYRGANPSDLVSLAPARTAGQVLIPGIAYESYHSLRFWAALLFETRRWQGRPLPAEVADPFVQRTRRLYQTWWVEMRYRQDYADEWDVENVLSDVTWLRDHYALLWR
ncbi:MAG: hypothetical protein KAY37_12170 [Phycisphaerae bacterium]|nr:hypothetical protein [Phycisphaerae bacterium]